MSDNNPSQPEDKTTVPESTENTTTESTDTPTRGTADTPAPSQVQNPVAPSGDTNPTDPHAQRMQSVGQMFSGIGDMAEGLGTAAEKMKATVTLSEASASTKMGEEALKTMGNTDLATIIAAPLNAAINAQYAAAKKTLECINEFGVKNGALSVVTFTFFKNGKKAKLAIPLLTLVPINNMRINEMTYNFKLAIKTSSQLNMVNGSQADFGAYGGVGVSDAWLNGGKPSSTAQQPPKSQNAESPNPAKTGETTKKTDVQETSKAEPQNANAAPSAKPNADDPAPAISPASSEAIKKSVRTEPTFGVSFSSKKDSKATQDSKYSVETSMDVSIKVGPEDMPGGISKMLEILNDSIEVFNPNGELAVSADKVKLSGGYALVSATYYDTEGNISPEMIKCSKVGEDDVTIESTNNGDSRQFLFTLPGLYLLTAGKLKYMVTVEN